MHTHACGYVVSGIYIHAGDPCLLVSSEGLLQSVQNLTTEKSRRVGKALHVMVTHPCGERARWCLDLLFEYRPLQGTCSAAAKASPFARVSLPFKLQALAYDILPWRKVPESDARSVPPPHRSLESVLLFKQRMMLFIRTLGEPVWPSGKA